MEWTDLAKPLPPGPYTLAGIDGEQAYPGIMLGRGRCYEEMYSELRGWK